MHRGNVLQALRADVEAEEQKRIVAHMHQIGGENRARSSAYSREDNAHKNQHGDFEPAAPELRRVHGPEQDSRDDDARRNAPLAREHGIQIAAENGFFKEGSEGDAENHEPDYVGARVKKVLDGQVGFLSGELRNESAKHRESDAATNANQIDANQIDRGRRDGAGAQSAPVKRAPKGRLVVFANDDEQKQQNDSGPEGLQADSKTGVRGDELQKLAVAEMVMYRDIRNRGEIDDKEGNDGEAEENQQLGSAPRSADIFRNVGIFEMMRREINFGRGVGFGNLRGSLRIACGRIVGRQWIFGIGESHRV